MRCWNSGVRDSVESMIFAHWVGNPGTNLRKTCPEKMSCCNANVHRDEQLWSSTCLLALDTSVPVPKDGGNSRNPRIEYFRNRPGS